MKTEMDQKFEFGDDTGATKFHRWAVPVTLGVAYAISIAGAIGIVKLANWLAQQ